MAVGCRFQRTAPQTIHLLMPDNQADPLWHMGRQDALQCAQAALRSEQGSGGGWGLLALLGGLVGVLIGGTR